MSKQISIQIILPNGDKVWVLNPGELDINNFDWEKAIFHRDDDLPAVIYVDSGKCWYKNGKIHRDGDNPAVDFDFPTIQIWYKNGKLHRDNDLPAKIYIRHTRNLFVYKEWWSNGIFVRKESK